MLDSERLLKLYHISINKCCKLCYNKRKELTKQGGNHKMAVIKKIIKYTGLFTGVIWGINKTISFLSKQSNTFNKNHYFEYNSPFGIIKYKKYGDGKAPLLLIHNLSAGDNLNEWNYISEYFLDHYTVYAINLLGCGNSDKSNLVYTNYMYVKLINDFINDVIGEKTDIITSGYSNRIAVMTSVYNHNIIGKIAMINSYGPEDIKHNVLFSKIINIPIFGTFIYNFLFTKNRCIANTENDFNLYHYMNSYYDSIHYDNSKSKYLYTSIMEKKTYIDYQKAMSSIKNETYSYLDNTHTYPHISTPKLVADKILDFLNN